jgi:hypothetical protein
MFISLVAVYGFSSLWRGVIVKNFILYELLLSTESFNVFFSVVMHAIGKVMQ